MYHFGCNISARKGFMDQHRESNLLLRTNLSCPCEMVDGDYVECRRCKTSTEPPHPQDDQEIIPDVTDLNDNPKDPNRYSFLGKFKFNQD